MISSFAGNLQATCRQLAGLSDLACLDTLLQEIFNKSEGISIWNYNTATKSAAAVIPLFQKNYTYEAVSPTTGATKTFYAWAKLDCDDCYIAITGGARCCLEGRDCMQMDVPSTLQSALSCIACYCRCGPVHELRLESE